MRRHCWVVLWMAIMGCWIGNAIAQEAAESNEVVETSDEDGKVDESVVEKANEIVAETKAKVDEISKKVDETKEAQEVSAGILQPIYALAEYLAFPGFYWLAFALMATGVVSFSLQLVLGKLVLLLKAGFSFTEICSDLMGLAISLAGLVLTTQAATENSSFTRSPAAVLSATIVGVALGFIYYWWGQSQEIQALRGRQAEAKRAKKK